MRFAVSLFGYAPRADSGRTVYRRAQGTAALVGELGFDGVGSGQHWLSDGDWTLQPLPLLAAVAGEVPGLWVNVTQILPLVQPVRLAEELATLDAITDGRTLLTAVLGYAEHEFAAFGVPRSERGRRFEEIVPILRGLWSGEALTHDGAYPLAGAVAGVRPTQSDGLPIWVGADGSAGLARAARCGDAWAMATHLAPAELATKVDELGRLRGGDGAGPTVRGPARQPLARIAYVAETAEQARAEALPHVRRRGAAYARIDQAAEMDDPERFAAAFAGRDLDPFLIGDPAAVADQIVAYQRLCGVDYLTFVVLLPGMDQARVERSLRLIAADVLPRVRAALVPTTQEAP